MAGVMEIASAFFSAQTLLCGQRRLHPLNQRNRYFMLKLPETSGATVSFSRTICQLVILPQIEHLASVAQHSDVLVRIAAIAELARLLTCRTEALHTEIAAAIVARARALLAHEANYVARKLLGDLCRAAD
jgi:hypothetical protein